MTTATPEALAILRQKWARVGDMGFSPDQYPQEDVNRCPVCKSDKRHQLTNRDRYGFHVNSMECQDCGCVYLTPRMTADGYGEFYRLWYRKILSAWYGQSIEWTPDYVADQQRMYIEAFLRPANIQNESNLFLPHLEARHAGRLLDIGGSTGIHADALFQRFSYRVTVVDPARDELALAAERGFRTIESSAESMPCCEQYDVITMLQTVEHLSRPRDVFRMVRGMLAPDGVFLFDARPFEEQRIAIKPLETLIKVDHPCYFTRHCLMRLIQEAGLKLVCFDCQVPGHFHFLCKGA